MWSWAEDRFPVPLWITSAVRSRIAKDSTFLVATALWRKGNMPLAELKWNTISGLKWSPGSLWPHPRKAAANQRYLGGLYYVPSRTTPICSTNDVWSFIHLCASNKHEVCWGVWAGGRRRSRLTFAARLQREQFVFVIRAQQWSLFHWYSARCKQNSILTTV